MRPWALDREIAALMKKPCFLRSRRAFRAGRLELVFEGEIEEGPDVGRGAIAELDRHARPDHQLGVIGKIEVLPEPRAAA